MRVLFTICLVLVVSLITDLRACRCANEQLIKRIASAEFVGSIKVLALTEDTLNDGYHDLKIETTELFKGRELATIKVLSRLDTSCGFLPPVGSEWLVFAQTFNGLLSFGLCSGPTDLDPDKWRDHPNAFVSNQVSVKRKLDFLRFVKAHEVKFDKFSTIGIGLCQDVKQRLKGFTGPVGDFSIYSFQVGERQSISKVKAIKEFANPKLARAFLKCIKKGLKDERVLDIIPAGTVVTSTLFFYPGRKGGDSFVSILDL